MGKRFEGDRLMASIAECWLISDAAGQVQIERKYGAALVRAAVTGMGRLRPTQMPPPGDWSIWAILAGRGFGKTRTGAEWILEVASTPGRRLALVGPSLESARAVMVEGESGLLARATAQAGLVFRPSLHRLEWANGSQARLFSGGEPDGLRGGQFDFGWGDEFAHWPRAEATLTNLRMATRLGAWPQLLLTTTPLPLPWLKALLAEPDVVVTRGRMGDNSANLPPAFLRALEARYGGTSVGRQEIEGELIETLEGALWSRALLEAQRRRAVPELVRVVVGVDPPAGGAAAVCGSGSGALDRQMLAGGDGPDSFEIGH